MGSNTTHNTMSGADGAEGAARTSTSCCDEFVLVDDLAQHGVDLPDALYRSICDVAKQLHDTRAALRAHDAELARIIARVVLPLDEFADCHQHDHARDDPRLLPARYDALLRAHVHVQSLCIDLLRYAMARPRLAS